MGSGPRFLRAEGMGGFEKRELRFLGLRVFSLFWFRVRGFGLGCWPATG